MFKDSSGSTLIESLVAFGLMTSLAVGIYPVFFQTQQQSKRGDARMLCESIVRSKLDEYRLGRPTRISDAATPGAPPSVYNGMPAMPQLYYLSLPTLSATSSQSLGSNTVSSGNPQNTGMQLSPSGDFFYAKLRYNRFYPYSCNGISNAQIIQNAPPNIVNAMLGMRECVGNNLVPNALYADSGDPTTVSDCQTPIDGNVQTELPGFKLYVRLELQTNWPIPNGGAPRPVRRPGMRSMAFRAPPADRFALASEIGDSVIHRASPSEV